jgi:hypothetical protein
MELLSCNRRPAVDREVTHHRDVGARALAIAPSSYVLKKETSEFGCEFRKACDVTFGYGKSVVDLNAEIVLPRSQSCAPTKAVLLAGCRSSGR